MFKREQMISAYPDVSKLIEETGVKITERTTVFGWVINLSMSWVEYTTKLPKWMSAIYVFANHVYVAPLVCLKQHCAYALVRFRHRNHLIMVGNVHVLALSTLIHMEIVPTSHQLHSVLLPWTQWKLSWCLVGNISFFVRKMSLSLIQTSGFRYHWHDL